MSPSTVVPGLRELSSDVLRYVPAGERQLISEQCGIPLTKLLPLSDGQKLSERVPDVVAMHTEASRTGLELQQALPPRCGVIADRARCIGAIDFEIIACPGSSRALLSLATRGFRLRSSDALQR